MKTLFEQSGGTYKMQGDYKIPDVILPAQKEYAVGVWGQHRLRYLKEQRKILYHNLLVSCKLYSHLADIEEQAENLYFGLIKQFAEREGVTEKLKAENPMEWIQKMNSIRNRAMEIVNTEIIYDNVI